MVGTTQRQTAKRQTVPTEQEYIFLREITWDTFEALLVSLQSQPGKRLTYSEGNLEIWMPNPPHEKYKKLLGRLVETLTEELDIEICSLGSSTWNRRDLRKGLEADQCYYIQNEPTVRNRLEINLEVDPPPDLAIEVDMTSLSIPRLPIYQELGVPEIWRFDGEQLTFLKLGDDEYDPVEKSIALPLVDVNSILELLMDAQAVGETSWVKKVRRWAQNLGNG